MNWILVVVSLLPGTYDDFERDLRNPVFAMGVYPTLEDCRSEMIRWASDNEMELVLGNGSVTAFSEVNSKLKSRIFCSKNWEDK